MNYPKAKWPWLQDISRWQSRWNGFYKITRKYMAWRFFLFFSNKRHFCLHVSQSNRSNSDDVFYGNSLSFCVRRKKDDHNCAYKPSNKKNCINQFLWFDQQQSDRRHLFVLFPFVNTTKCNIKSYCKIIVSL